LTFNVVCKDDREAFRFGPTIPTGRGLFRPR
jgi:hypothetical protein